MMGGVKKFPQFQWQVRLKKINFNGAYGFRGIKFKLVGSMVLELFECRQGDPYITANRNFVRYAHW